MEFDPQRCSDKFRFSEVYEEHKQVGLGAYGRVVHCTNRKTNKDCAVKVISKTSDADLAVIASEVHILASLTHPNVVGFRAVHQDDSTIYIEMELLRGGSLSDLLRQRRLCEEEAATVMRGVLSAVSYMHRRAILHRDLKPDNILFAEEGNLASVKVTDFGLSAKFGQKTYDAFEESCGTVAFMAPEQINRSWYSKPVDIWSCGLLLYMTVVGHHPMLAPDDTVESYIEKLKNPAWEFPSNMNAQVKQLFLHMVNMQAVERYTAEQALAHPWVARTTAEIPKTYLEKVADYNAQSRLKTILSALVGIGAVLYSTQGPVRFAESCVLEKKCADIKSLETSPSVSPGVSADRNRRRSAGFLALPSRIVSKPSPMRSKSPSRSALLPTSKKPFAIKLRK